MDVNDSGKEVNHERLDNLRRGRGPIQEHIIDEFVAGNLIQEGLPQKGHGVRPFACPSSVASLRPRVFLA